MIVMYECLLTTNVVSELTDAHYFCDGYGLVSVETVLSIACSDNSGKWIETEVAEIKEGQIQIHYLNSDKYVA
jgi:hypothetical protein